MIDEITRRDSERLQSTNRREVAFFSRSRSAAHISFERNDDTFLTMMSSKTSTTTGDRLSNLASLLQTRSSVNNPESQSQIVKDDNNNAFQSLESHINDSDAEDDLRSRIQNSNNEQSIRENRARLITFNVFDTQQSTSSQFKTVRKSRHRDANRRFILNCQDEKIEDVKITLILKIINWVIDSSIILRLNNVQNFIRNVAKRFENWWNEINELDATASLMSERIIDHEFTIEQFQIFHIAQSDKLNDTVRQYNFVQKQLLKTQTRIIIIEKKFFLKVNKQKQKTARLRQLKDEHKQKKNHYVEEIRTFRVDKAILEKKVQNLKIKQSDYHIVSHRYSIVSQDSNSENDFFQRENRRHNSYNAWNQSRIVDQTEFVKLNRLLNFLARNSIEERFRLTAFEQSVSHYDVHNLELNDHRILLYKKTKNIKNYYDDHSEWKSWKNEILTKFWINARQYLIERHKINYVRKHFKSVIYDTIAHRVQMNNVNFYNVFVEMFADLEKAFDIKNEKNKKISELFSSSFHQNFKNKNEIFDEFMIRFNALVVFLRLENNILIDQLRKKMKSALSYKMWIFENIENWKQFVIKCRNVCDDLKHVDRYKIDKTTSSTIKATRVRRSNRSKKSKFDKSQSDTKIYIVKKNSTRRTTRLFNHIVERLRKKNRCFKCFKKSHIAENRNVFCKNEKSTSKNTLSIVLAAIDIEWNEMKKEWIDDMNDDVLSLSFENEFQTRN